MESLEKRLSRLDKKKLKNKDGKTLEVALWEQAIYLRSLIQKHLDIYLAEDPVEYAFHTGSRTGSLQNSISVDDIINIRVNGNRLEIYVYFDEKAYHGSGFGVWKKYDSHDVNTAELLNYGYRVKKDVWFKNIKNFGWREPAGFLEDAIDEFNSTNSLGIRIGTGDITRT